MKFGQNKVDNKDESVVEKKQELEYTSAPDLNSSAFSLTRHPEGGFALVTVKFNPVTMEARVETVKKVSDSREEGEYYFRIKIGEYFAGEGLKS